MRSRPAGGCIAMPALLLHRLYFPMSWPSARTWPFIAFEQSIPGETRFLRKLSIQSIDFKKVPVRPSRRARPSIAVFAEIIDAVPGSVLQSLVRRYALRAARWQSAVC